jgi:hypothetical protein
MVAERKELERNVLVEQLGRAYEGIKQGPSRGTVIFLAVVAAAVIIFLLFRYFQGRSTELASERWVKLDGAVFAEQVESLVTDKDYQDTPQYRLARFKEARLKLAGGLRDLGNPALRKDARKNIGEARDIYEELAKSPGRIPLLHQEALWGAAKAYESLGGPDNIEKARELYDRLRKEYESSALGKDAKKQLDRLDSSAKDLQELARELAGKP